MATGDDQDNVQTPRYPPSCLLCNCCGVNHTGAALEEVDDTSAFNSSGATTGTVHEPDAFVLVAESCSWTVPVMAKAC